MKAHTGTYYLPLRFGPADPVFVGTSGGGLISGLLTSIVTSAMSQGFETSDVRSTVKAEETALVSLAQKKK